jgi:biotin carboxyl carrier protein
VEFHYEHKGELYKVEIVKDDDNFIVKVGGQTYSLMEVLERSEGLLKFSLNRRPYKCRVASEGELRHVFIDGNVYQVKKVVKRKRGAGKKGKKGTGDDTAGSGQIQSPINGKIIKVRVMEDASVKSGQDLILIEAMKMEHRIKTPVDGKVRKIHVKEGDQVELGTLLVELVTGNEKNKKAE